MSVDMCSGDIHANQLSLIYKHMDNTALPWQKEASDKLPKSEKVLLD